MRKRLPSFLRVAKWSPLLPAHAARLAGFTALALLGALQWQRLVAGLSAGRALVWVLIAVAAALAVLWGASRERWAGLLTSAAALLGLFGAYAASGIPLALLKPRRWDELVDGLARGSEALGTVDLPYQATDPWPALTLQLLGGLLCVLAGMLAFWPRDERERGYRFLALSTLLVLVISPLVSLGGDRQVLIGCLLAALTVCFLFLERMHLRPGLALAALLALPLAGALPLAAAADGDEPWFDYRSFAEGIGPEDPIRFNWGHTYGPINWPREGEEVVRVASKDPSYWKMRDLTVFDGEVWRAPELDEDRADPMLDLPPDFAARPEWTETLQVSVRRLETTDVVTAGTAVRVADASRPIRRAGQPGRWIADEPLVRGDSYTVNAHIPRPSPRELQRSGSGDEGQQDGQLIIAVPFAAGAPDDAPVRGALVKFPSFEDYLEGDIPLAGYPQLGRTLDGASALEASQFRRTWRLSQRLRRDADTPYEYVQAVDSYLEDEFSYAERPDPVGPGVATLEGFLFDTQTGHCQHYSGAMALLLRMGGVPARVSTGFSPGGFSQRKNAWVVRDTDAHSWVEVWFDDYGWVAFDPTPPATPARSQIGALDTAPDPADSAGDAAGSSSTNTPDTGRLDRGTAGSASGATGGDGGGVSGWWALLPLAALAIAGGVWALRRRHRSQPPRVQLDRLVAELEAALRRSGRPAGAGTTLRQLESRFARGNPEAAAYLRALSSGRYGVRTVLPTPAQRKALRRELAVGLGAGGRLRTYLALPPWRA